jgi:hypothetical protein
LSYLDHVIGREVRDGPGSFYTRLDDLMDEKFTRNQVNNVFNALSYIALGPSKRGGSNTRLGVVAII